MATVPPGFVFLQPALQQSIILMPLLQVTQTEIDRYCGFLNCVHSNFTPNLHPFVSRICCSIAIRRSYRATTSANESLESVASHQGSFCPLAHSPITLVFTALSCLTQIHCLSNPNMSLPQSTTSTPFVNYNIRYKAHNKVLL